MTRRPLARVLVESRAILSGVDSVVEWSATDNKRGVGHEFLSADTEHTLLVLETIACNSGSGMHCTPCMHARVVQPRRRSSPCRATTTHATRKRESWSPQDPLPSFFDTQQRDGSKAESNTVPTTRSRTTLCSCMKITMSTDFEPLWNWKHF